MSSVERGHAAERKWGTRLEGDDPGRVSFRPRWALVDVISMKAGDFTYFDEVKTTAGGPYERFGPVQRKALVALAEKCGAVPRLIWWPDHAKKDGRPPRILLAAEWPT